MVFHMKTTLEIDDTVMAELRRQAASQRTTMSAYVETALRNQFRVQQRRRKRRPLPSFDSGGTLVDINDRNALYNAMEGE
jgi:hypothetical protein